MERFLTGSGTDEDSGTIVAGLAWTRVSADIETSFSRPVADATGQSRISVQDYAVAMIDELERPTRVRQRFTVGY
jgi:hypothetical protein